MAESTDTPPLMIGTDFKFSSVGPCSCEIIVVRHGETAWNVEGKIQVIEYPDLRERHLGDLQGLVLREAAKVCPTVYQAFLSHMTDQDIPGGGESHDKLYQRCTSAFQRMLRERVVVVTLGVIRTLYK